MKQIDINKENLKNILQSLAVIDDKQEYSQGMNFMAGFLYIVLKDEAKSFAVLKSLI